MTWQAWIAKKLQIQVALEKQKIIEYNGIIRALKIKLTQAERELQAHKAGFIPTLCNTCIHTYTPKPANEPIGTYEPPEPTTEGKLETQQRKYIPMIRTQHGLPRMPRHHKMTLHPTHE